MKKNFLSILIEKYNKARKSHHRWLRVVTALACVVVFITTYVLMIPAITMDRMLVCQLEEHVHSVDCLDADGNIACGKVEHTHSAACYDAPPAESTCICGFSEHEHGPECYDGEELTCTLPVHVHTVSCFANRTTPVRLLAVSDTAQWKVATSIDTSKNYLIVTTGGVALGNNNGTTSAATAGMKAVSGKTGVYTTDLDDNYVWKFISTDTANAYRVNNVGSSDYYIRLQSGGLSGTGNYPITFTYSTGDSNWTVANGGSYYRYRNGAFERTTSADNAVKFILYEEASASTLGCWQKVTAIDGNGPYMILSSDGHAIGVNGTAVSAGEANMKAVEGKDGYYTTELGKAYQWNFNTTGTNNVYTVTNVNSPTYYIRCNTGAISTNSTQIAPTYNTNGYWRLKRNDNSNYLSYNNGAFTSATSGNTRNMQIYQYVEIPITTQYWQKVTSITDEGPYMILSSDGHAIGVSGTAVSAGEANMKAVEGKDGYYTTELGEDYQWNFNATGTNNVYTVTNVQSPTYYIRCNSGAISTQSTQIAPTYNTNGYWRLKRNDNSNYLSYNNDAFTSATSGNTRNMQIYKLVTETPDEPDDPDDEEYGTTKTGTGNSTSYDIKVYAVKTDVLGWPIDTPELVGNTTVNTNTHFTTESVFTTLKNGGKLPSTSVYFGSYYGTEDKIDRDDVTELFRSGNGDTRYLGIVAGGQTVNQYLSDSDEKALYVRYHVSPGVKPQPTYAPDTTSVSGGKSGEISNIPSFIDNISNKIVGNYASDPSTSNIENKFFSVFNGEDYPVVNDGKILTDKSVIYMGDDYGAFESYDPDTFSVTLSALSQDYKISDTDQVKVPADVVFVIDVSGSMSSPANGSSGTTRREAVVNAVNSAMTTILTGEGNENNRVGVAIFSSGGNVLLPLDHYTAGNNGQFLNYDSNSGDIYTATNLKNPKGTVTRTNGEFDDFTQQHGTYTQYGIALGAGILTDNEDTTFTAKLFEGTDYEKTIAVPRQPVMILLSDGDPTHCTPEYDDVLNVPKGEHYGSGVYTTLENNKGIHGYYTILSANAYKKAITDHYKNSSTFYTIGMGINATAYTDLSAKSATGDAYKRAVLNPNAASMAAIIDDTAKSTAPNSKYTAAQTWSQSCEMLSLLLNNKYSGNTVTVLSTDDYDNIGETLTNVPVVKNEDFKDDYSYANGAYFGNLTADDLQDVFNNIIKSSISFKSYGFMLYKGSSVTFTDTIGSGMEIKGNPVLRYNGVNYPVTIKSKAGAVTEYVCNALALTKDGSGIDGAERSADLSQLVIKATENADGTTTVDLEIPESVIPSYTPDMNEDWYYEALPVRLIYQVGLSDYSKNEVKNLGKGESVTYYTNAWGSNNSARDTQTAHQDNPYYNDVTYKNGFSRTHVFEDYTTPKTQNTTATAANSISAVSSASGDTHIINAQLGNNGKLVFTNTDDGTVPVYLVKVDEDGNPVITDKATFMLGTDSAFRNAPKTLYTDENGQIKLSGILPSTTYYLKEVQAPNGYLRATGVLSFKVDENGAIVSFNAPDEEFYINNGKIYVENDENPTGGNEPPEGEVIPVHTKWIDSFRDGEDNPDTDLDDKADSEALKDLYRLYLNIGPEISYNDIDVLFVIDRSSSMYTASYGANDATDILGQHPVLRRTALNSMLNGIDTKGEYNVSALKPNGLIANIMAINPDNKVAVVGYSGERNYIPGFYTGSGSSITPVWTNGYPVTDETSDSGTNYVAGLGAANDYFNAVKDDGNEKILIFLSDGAPTRYYTSLSGTGSPSSGSGNTATYTNSAIDQFQALWPDVKCYSIAVGDDYDDVYLSRLAYGKNGDRDGKLIKGEDFSVILDYLDEEITGGVGRFSNLKMSDKLSEYVDFYTDDLDVVIKKIPERSGTEEILYQNGALTTDGEKYIKKQNGVVINQQDKTITIDFADGYVEEGHYTFQLSFNVKATKKAYDDYEDNVISGGLVQGYDGNVGDNATDYGTNKTSSNKPGFDSNDSAYFEYDHTHGGEPPVSYKLPFDEPVIQVNGTNLPVRKVWADGNDKHSSDPITVDLYMKIPGSADLKIATAVLDPENDWEYTFETLPKGYEYYVVESGVPDGYESTYNVNAEGFYVITNTPVTGTVKVQKSWITNSSSVTPNSATFVLYLDNGTTIAPVYDYLGNQCKITIDVYDGWEGEIQNVPIISEGTLYLVEEPVKNFTPTVSGSEEIVIGDKKYVAVKVDAVKDSTITVSFINVSNSELPATGGIGDNLFYILGALLLASAAMIGFVRFKKRASRAKQ